MTARDTPGSLTSLQTMLDVTQRLGATVELTPLLTLVADAACRVLQSERATLFLHDAARDQLVSRVATGAEEIRIPSDSGIAGECFTSERCIYVPDAYADARFNREVDRTTGFHTRNLLTLPLCGHDGGCVGVLQVLNRAADTFTTDDEQLALTLSVVAGVAIERQILLDEYARKQQMERDLNLARRIQQSLLPRSQPQLPGLDIAGYNEPADATGGDCYDFMIAPDHLGILVADATGHGIGPALVVSQMRSMVRALHGDEGDLIDALARVNELLCHDLPTGMFVTAFLGFVEAQSAAFSFASMGQAPLLHYEHAAGKVHELNADYIPMGIMADLDRKPLRRITLAPGDLFAVMTDGFFEYANEQGELFGYERVAKHLMRSDDLSCEQTIHTLRAELERFGNGRPADDDLTAVLVRRNA